MCWPRLVTGEGFSALTVHALESQGGGIAPEALALGAKYKGALKIQLSRQTKFNANFF